MTFLVPKFGEIVVKGTIEFLKYPLHSTTCKVILKKEKLNYENIRQFKDFVDFINVEEIYYVDKN